MANERSDQPNSGENPEESQGTGLQEAWEEAERGDENIIHEGIQPLFGLLETAINHSATDVHIDPVGDQYLVRFRINGVINTHEKMPPEEAKRLLIQIRVRANLDITRSFTPREGQCKWLVEDQVKDIRVTTVPRNGDTSIHLRILSPPENLTNIEMLGLRDKDLEIVRRSLAHPQGLIIVGGPTGAGKTTTIYSLANTYDLESIVGVSIEDPIEFNIPYLRQVEVDSRHDFHMPDGLRALLRMDPDLLLVPEIRDERSALTTVRAAVSANFVLSTIHSKDAASAVEAFAFLSVPYNILGGALRVIIAQNLVRTLCPACRVSRRPSGEDRALFEQWEIPVPDAIFDANPGGCDRCDRYGFSGRTGIFEVVDVDQDIGNAIVEGSAQAELRRLFRQKGYGSIFKSGLDKVVEGTTSMPELLDLYWPEIGGAGID